MADYEHWEVQRRGDVWVVRPLHPKLTGDLPSKVTGELFTLASQSDCLKILLDLSGVTQMSSEMFAKLIVLSKQAVQKKGSVKMCQVCPDIRQILADTHLDQLFAVYDTEAAGIAAFG